MAMRLFRDMRTQKISPDTVTFNSLISANAAAGRTRDALELLKECLNEPGVEPDIITYTNAIR
jgi:pentatricopeptide repeat protein